MQFYFIRHGQSENNALWERGGPQSERRADPELTELGHKQAQHLAQFLAQQCVPCELGEEGGYGAAARGAARARRRRGDAQNVERHPAHTLVLQPHDPRHRNGRLCRSGA